MLTYDQLQCIGAVIAARGKFPHLVTAIDNELIEAQLTRPTETESMPETDTMVGQIKTARRVIETPDEPDPANRSYRKGGWHQ